MKTADWQPAATSVCSVVIKAVGPTDTAAIYICQRIQEPGSVFYSSLFCSLFSLGVAAPAVTTDRHVADRTRLETCPLFVHAGCCNGSTTSPDNFISS
ncbi:hypothetical protein J6590_020890 [Homalodisca vitripennis]|nr:hypothetical protein J6590_020890 [Homalodisca vitripennis]